MTKLEEIKQRWARMQTYRYNLYRITELPPEPLPWLCVASDRNGEEHPAITAITGPLNDSDSLEDAIAYAEAPTDIAHLLTLLDAAIDAERDAYAQGWQDHADSNPMRGE